MSSRLYQIAVKARKPQQKQGSYSSDKSDLGDLAFVHQLNCTISEDGGLGDIQEMVIDGYIIENKKPELDILRYLVYNKKE